MNQIIKLSFIGFLLGSISANARSAADRDALAAQIKSVPVTNGSRPVAARQPVPGRLNAINAMKIYAINSVYNINERIENLPGTPPPASIYINQPPYSISTGQDVGHALQAALDSLHYTYNGGNVYLPGSYTFGRLVAGSQKGVHLWSNCHIIGKGGRITYTNNSAFVNTDFGTDSTGLLITADITDSSTKTIQVASTAGAHVGDTVFGRFGTEPYDAPVFGEPLYWDWFTIARIPDGRHITLDHSCGALLNVAATKTLNRRLVIVHNLTTNASVENLELYAPGTGGAQAEAGVIWQGCWGCTVKDIHGTNMGAGVVTMQFAKNCLYENVGLDYSNDFGIPSWGRGVSIAESKGIQFNNCYFKGYKKYAILIEANSKQIKFYNTQINNSYDNNSRVAILQLGSAGPVMEKTVFSGFKHFVVDQNNGRGNTILSNTTFTKGTPFSFYENNAVTVVPPLVVGDEKYTKRKTLTQRVLLRSNTVNYFDGPKGKILKAFYRVDDTTGIYGARFYRVRDGTSNTGDFARELVPGKNILIKSLGEYFSVGVGLPAGFTNNSNDKGFFIACNKIRRDSTWGVMTWEYLEQDGAPVNKYNAITYDPGPVIQGGASGGSKKKSNASPLKKKK